MVVAILRRSVSNGLKAAFVASAIFLAAPAQAAPPLPPLPGRTARMSPALEEALVRRASGLFRPETLPPGSPYLPHRAVCGTPIIAEIASRWHQLSKSTQDSFAPLLFARRSATLPNSYQSPGGNFLVHYALSGTHAVSSKDEDGNGIPDYVDQT